MFLFERSIDIETYLRHPEKLRERAHARPDRTALRSPWGASFFENSTEGLRVQFRAACSNIASSPNPCVDCPGTAGRITNIFQLAVHAPVAEPDESDLQQVAADGGGDVARSRQPENAGCSARIRIRRAASHVAKVRSRKGVIAGSRITM